MAFTALYDGDERGAWGVPRSERATCPECGDEMHVVSESTDGRARHFSHNPDRTGAGGGGGGCSGGESDDHKKWKNFAAERLHEIFGDRAAARASVEEPLAAPWSDKEDRAADACVFFENWDNQFGRGLAIEVQHKNKDKDIHAVEMDYNRQGVAVLWLSGVDFHDNGLRMREVDIRHRTREQTSICELADNWFTVELPNGVTQYNARRPDTHEQLVYETHDPRDRRASVPATVLADWVLPTTAEYWRGHDWEAAFRSPEGRYNERSYRLQAAIPQTVSTVTVDAFLPHDWFWPTPREHWRDKGWNAAFGEQIPDGTFEALQEQSTAEMECSFPPNVVDGIVYQRLDMESLEENSALSVERGECTTIRVSVPEAASKYHDVIDTRYRCRDCTWRGDQYSICKDGSAGGTAVCPLCESGIRLNS